MTERPELNEDFVDLLRALVATQVEFLIVGAHALAAHGIPRATGDLGVLVQPSAENAERILDALRGRPKDVVDADALERGEGL